jgi:dTDP-4-amino-4,6-dideoxygalactose transaminase
MAIPTKRSAEELAVFGHPPAFASPLHVGRPNVLGEERFFARARRALSDRWLSNDGPLVKEFERQIEAHTGVRHCIAMSSATVGLQLAGLALRLRGEVIVPSFTFIATVHALTWLGAKPVFCDVDPRTHNIDPDQVARLVTPETSGILGVHLWGRGCDAEALEAIAAKHGLVLMFDAAHAFGCSHGGRMIGGFGDAEVFSFHATKVINSFEGGAVVTNNDALAEKLRLLRNFGFTGPDNVVGLGTNAKMSEISAAMGLTSLEHLDEIVSAGLERHLLYAALLDGVPGLCLCRPPANERFNYHYVTVEVDAKAAGLSRDDLVAALRSENVLARRYFYPGCHRMEPYLTLYPDAGRSLPVSLGLAECLLQLPAGAAVSPSDVEAICGLIRLIMLHGPAVRDGVRRLSDIP